VGLFLALKLTPDKLNQIKLPSLSKQVLLSNFDNLRYFCYNFGFGLELAKSKNLNQNGGLREWGG
jgi:hypothetical protein